MNTDFGCVKNSVCHEKKEKTENKKVIYPELIGIIIFIMSTF